MSIPTPTICSVKNTTTESKTTPYLHNCFCDNVCQSSSIQVFHHHPQLILQVVTVQEVNNVLMLVCFHDLNLRDYELFLGLVVQVHHLDSHHIAISFMFGHDNTARCTGGKSTHINNISTEKVSSRYPFFSFFRPMLVLMSPSVSLLHSYILFLVPPLSRIVYNHGIIVPDNINFYLPPPPPIKLC